MLKKTIAYDQSSKFNPSILPKSRRFRVSKTARRLNTIAGIFKSIANHPLPLLSIPDPISPPHQKTDHPQNYPRSSPTKAWAIASLPASQLTPSGLSSLAQA
jgi:hypothetical protein